jgi:hypothetical protein
MALSDVDWDSRNGHYRVRLRGEWIDVPDDTVITEPNRAGRAMVWPYYINGHPVSAASRRRTAMSAFRHWIIAANAC